MNGNAMAKAYARWKKQIEANPYVLVRGKNEPDFPARVIWPLERKSDSFEKDARDHFKTHRGKIHR